MIHFIIPFRGKITTPNWPEVCRLLGATLRSVCNQTNPEFRVSVICHEKPDLSFTHPAITYHHLPVPPPEVPPELVGRARLLRLRADKGRKLLFGISLARDLGDDYLMFVDADDYVSARLAAHVIANPHPHGWYIGSGYMQKAHQPSLLYPRSCFHHECGSSHIVRTTRIPYPAKMDLTAEDNTWFVEKYPSHRHLCGHMDRAGAPLTCLPFPRAVYVLNDHSIYSSTLRPKDSLLRATLRLLVKGRWLTPSLKREFGIRALTPQKGNT